jgi:ATP-dependent RNA helicase HelY
VTLVSRRERFLAALGFGVDDFQLEAFEVVDQGENVLVSAPTGSGKTLIATYAIERQLDTGQRSFYTTPLKALSNQKYHELVARYGEAHVGLLTGDTSINRDAEIVVMTTEVLRNMLLGESRQTRELGLVVLDEVHFLQDPFRGGVWEEVLILTPKVVQFVALSATVSNARVLGEWLSEVRGVTRVVLESTRPISLHNHVAVVRRNQELPELIDLLKGTKLSDEARRIDALMKTTRKFRPGNQWHGAKSSAPPPPFRTPRRSELLQVMDAQDLLPAIVFIFSRAACDDAVRQVRRDGLLFTNPEQRAQIRAIAAEKVAEFSDDDLQALEYHEFVDALERGIAAHHAGMVPAFRETVEACFEANLMGVVFATETLALGVNMPARSVVLERFNKYSDDGRHLLTSGEFAQLTGRAGRRGLDDEGHAVICFATETSMVDVGRVAISPPPDLHSSFRPTYNFTANLIHHFDHETAVEILQQSYAQFEADRRASGARRPLAELMSARHHVLEDLGYAEDWSLTNGGQQLRAVYHECDLLIVEALRSGIFDDAEPATVAAVLSAFVYEPKRAKRTGPHRHTPARKQRVRNDRLGDQRRSDINQRVGSVMGLAAYVSEVEDRYKVAHTKDPDPGFASTIAAWVRGAPLTTVLEIADHDAGQLSPGDFVRNAKQVGDLCEQMARLSPGTDLAAAAEEARFCIIRSVVAGVSVIPPTADGAL